MDKKLYCALQLFYFLMVLLAYYMILTWNSHIVTKHCKCTKIHIFKSDDASVQLVQYDIDPCS